MGSAKACIYLVMAFGALLALIGVFLSTRGEPQGRSSLKIFQFEFQLAGSPLVIFVVGCALFVIPLFAGDKLAALFAAERKGAYTGGDGGGGYQPEEVFVLERVGGGPDTADQEPDEVFVLEPVGGGPDTADQEPAVRATWQEIKAAMGEHTGATQDILTFWQVVLAAGSIDYSNTLDLGGKEGVDRCVITVTDEYPYSSPLGVEYVYREYTASIEMGGNWRRETGLARKPRGADELWQAVAVPGTAEGVAQDFLEGILAMPW